MVNSRYDIGNLPTATRAVVERQPASIPGRPDRGPLVLKNHWPHDPEKLRVTPLAGGPMTLKKSGLGWPHHPAKIIRLLAPSGCKPAFSSRAPPSVLLSASDSRAG